MNCPDIKNLLSAYLDGELADELRADVSAHLERCPDCTHEFQGFEKLSRMASTLQSAVPPEHLWKRIETELDQSLDADRSRRQPMAWAARWFVASPRWMTAAALLVAIGISWFAYQAWTPQGKHEQFTADFSHYLTEFRRDPDVAQQFLLAKYEHRPLLPDQAIQTVGYRPAVANGLPPDYRMESTNVINMPCCTCVETVCQRSDGSRLVIFEHNDLDPQWFDDRPEIAAHCQGRQCRLVEVNDRLAATWSHDQRHITVIGIQDLDELSQLVAWFDNGK